uniref:Uncharacterized protein n=1 Tax=viral metagenome TaxID=1070528 RepID=A0A6C0F9N3_9ZZZZ|tara:strand:- start:31641 stop:32456 length:816 start_codon:yes stop_codon:yes gene_type:complete
MKMTFRLFVILIAIILGIYFCITQGKDPEPEPNSETEGFESTKLSTDEKCPNLLIQKDGKIYLTNTKEKEVPGVNPIVFDNLEEYVEFMKWHRSQGLKCPVLFLQKTHDTQGKITYKVRPDIIDPQGGLPPKADNPTPAPGSPQNAGKQVNMDLDGVNDVPFFKTGGGEITGHVALNTGPQEIKLVDAGRNDLPYNENSMPSFDDSNYYQGTITPMDKQLADQRKLEKSPSAMDSNWGGIKYTNSLISSGAYDGRRRSRPGFRPDAQDLED